MGPKLATVVGVSPDGKVTVRYDGDGAPSQKALNKYTSYVPQLGDRVHVVNGVVAGGWRP
jgi:hypothetical protein